MKTVIVSAYHGWTYRNLLGSSALHHLHEMTGAHVVVCVPPDREVFIRETYGAPWIEVVPFDAETVAASRYNRFWYRLGFLIQNTQYIRDKRLERYWQHRNIVGWINYHVVNTVAAVLSKIPAGAYLYRNLDYKLSTRSAIDEILHEYHPALVVVGDLFGESDVLFLRSAKAHGLRTVGMVRSWDNTTTKGILRLVPDHIIANSKVIRDELVSIHRVVPEVVAVVGLPQFDGWLNGPTVSRAEFFARIGADSTKRMVLFAPAGNALSDTDWQLCEILKDAIKRRDLPDDILILIRNHPQHRADLTKFEPDEHFVIENPGTLTPRGYYGATLDPEENNHLRNSIYYSQLVMYVATSIGLDASVYDKPQIIVSFDGHETRPYVRSVNRHNREDCLANMVASGGTRVVSNAGQWIREVNAYLVDAARDSEGRERARRDHVYPLDGKAGVRVADVICSELSPDASA